MRQIRRLLLPTIDKRLTQFILDSRFPMPSSPAPPCEIGFAEVFLILLPNELRFLFNFLLIGFSLSLSLYGSSFLSHFLALCSSPSACWLNAAVGHVINDKFINRRFAEFATCLIKSNWRHNSKCY